MDPPPARNSREKALLTPYTVVNNVGIKNVNHNLKLLRKTERKSVSVPVATETVVSGDSCCDGRKHTGQARYQERVLPKKPRSLINQDSAYFKMLISFF